MATEKSLQLVAPLSGTTAALGDCCDPIFAYKMVGDGLVIEPSDNNLVVAPCDGVITDFPASRHAFTLKTRSGAEILVHIGIDTGVLRGEGFEALVSAGATVTAGQPLVRFDRAIIEARATSLQTVVLITSGEHFAALPAGQTVIAGETAVISLGDATLAGAETGTPENGAHGSLSAEVLVRNPHGLHARPISNLIKIIRNFSCEVTIQNLTTGKEGRANSLTGLLSLQLGLGVQAKVTVTGVGAEAALAAIITGFETGLGESIVEQTTCNTASITSSVASIEECDIDENEAPLLGIAAHDDNTLFGVKAAPGLVIGQLIHQYRQMPEIPEYSSTDVETERQQLNNAISTANGALETLIASLTAEGNSHSEVFIAHQTLLDDPSIHDLALAMIDDGSSAAFAWHKSYTHEAASLKTLDDPLLAARAADVEDIGLRVLRHLLNSEVIAHEVPENTILVADDVTPSDVITFDRSRIIGLCTLEGGATSHAAILCGAMGIPYLVSVSTAIRDQADGTPAVLNGDKASITLHPSAEAIACTERLQQLAASNREAAQEKAHQPAITIDGHHVEIGANIGSAEDAIKAIENGADAIGLLRSEFLYMARATEPSIAEQSRSYHDILETMAGRPVIVRTMDVGGDKPLAYLPLPKEENPFLGERGIRIGIHRPAILRKQVRAILQAAHAGHVRIMLPMISTLNEFRAVKALVQKEQDKLGIDKVELGIMIEVPSAALMADLFAKEVDFFSIGTNDLTQYALAVDRGHPKLAAMVDGLHPSVLRLIDMTVKAANREGKWVGICGGLASDAQAVPVLVGLGVHELSVSIPAIAEIKAKVRELNYATCRQLAEQALMQDSAETVRQLTH